MIGRFTGDKPGLTWVIVLSAVELLTILFHAGPPLQPALGVLFVLTCPGFLLLDLERPADPAARIMIGIGGSIAANIIIVTLVLITDAGPVAPFIALALVAAALMPRRRFDTTIRWAGSLRRRSTPAPQPVAAPGPIQENRPQPEPQPVPETEPGPMPHQDVRPDPGPPPVIVLGVDINRAGVGPFTGLPGIGPDLATRIVAHREQHGPFADVNALLDVLRGMAIEEEARKI